MLDLPALEIQLPDNLRNATVQDERAPLATGYTAFLPNLDEFGAYCSKNPAQIRSNISVLAPRQAGTPTEKASSGRSDPRLPARYRSCGLWRGGALGGGALVLVMVDCSLLL